MVTLKTKHPHRTYRITSYINNLHPKTHKPLYKVIERIIELAIPLWNQTLTPLKSRHYNSPRIKYDSCEYDLDPEAFPEHEQPQQLPNETEDDYFERKDEWVHNTRQVVKPEPEKFGLPRWNLNKDGTQLDDGMRVDLRKEFQERGLQIIVKLANIHLSPEKRNYTGGTWHVEGQLVRFHSFLKRVLSDIYSHRTSIFAPPHSTIMIMLILPKAVCLSVSNPNPWLKTSTTSRTITIGSRRSLGAIRMDLLCNMWAASPPKRAASLHFLTFSSTV